MRFLCGAETNVQCIVLPDTLKETSDNSSFNDCVSVSSNDKLNVDHGRCVKKAVKGSERDVY